jgi:acetate kinase
MEKIILVINSGSSSIKFSLINISGNKTIMTGMAEKLELDDAAMHIKLDGVKEDIALEGNDHAAAMQSLLKVLRQKGLSQIITAIGHRVVHGGEKFKTATIINDEVIRAIEACTPFAPLHNPANLLGISVAMKTAPQLPQVAVFDTAFHQTLPEHAYLYAVPAQLYKEHSVRRYGFHGTSHQYVAQQAAKLLELPLNDSAFITAHLGNGASAAAILNGKSVDTTMGFTPLEGLVMGTRSGDIDPGLYPYIGKVLGLETDMVTDLLNKKSGLLGLSGLSSDVRELQDAAANGHEGAQLALKVFVHRLAKYIGALTVTLPRVDALVFTGGIGENSALIRSMVLEYLQVLGYKEDAEKNKTAVGGKQAIITATGSARAMVINTNEELMIAMETAALL